MGLLRTSGLTPDDYYKKERAWIDKALNVHTLKFHAETAVRIDKSNFDLHYDLIYDGYIVNFIAGQDIYEAMWVCTQLLNILDRPIKTRMNSMQIEWKPA